MSFPDSRRFSTSIVNEASTTTSTTSPSQPPTTATTSANSRNIPEKPRRKMSVFEASPKSSALLDETLFGLQEVSDLLQASLKELEESVERASQVPPRPPLRSSSHLASPVSSPGRSRRRSDTEAMSRPFTPPVLPPCVVRYDVIVIDVGQRLWHNG